MIEFVNIKSGEKRTVDTEPMLSAFYNSTDQHVNANVGQDMGWRLAPSIVARINKMKQDQSAINEIATKFNIPSDEVTETDFLRYISLQEAEKKQREKEGKEGASQDYRRQYEDEIRALEDEGSQKSKSQQRREDEVELAKKNGANAKEAGVESAKLEADKNKPKTGQSNG